MTTTVVNKNINFRHLMVLTIWLRISTLVIKPVKEARGSVFHPLIPLKLGASINLTDIIRSIINTQAINIFRQYVIVRSGMFPFESCQKYILAHVHSHCNIRFGGALLLWLCMGYFIFAYFLQIICLGYL